jgi:hypothetical protein
VIFSLVFKTLVTFFVCVGQLSGWFHWMCQGYLNKLFDGRVIAAYSLGQIVLP